MRARALAVHALARARGRPRRLLLSCSRRQRRKVDKCRVADKKQTDRQTNTHYSFIGIDVETQGQALFQCWFVDAKEDDRYAVQAHLVSAL